jgi:hypothetical protein
MVDAVSFFAYYEIVLQTSPTENTMSKGNRKLVVRIDPETVRQIERAVESHNLHETRFSEQWTASDLLRKAVEEYLSKLERARKSRKKAKVCCYCRHRIMTGVPYETLTTQGARGDDIDLYACSECTSNPE